MQKIESSTFKRWLAGIKDSKTKARITARLHRLMAGLPCDVKPVGHGISELRLHFGSGYRVYYYQDKDVLVVLLNGVAQWCCSMVAIRVLRLMILPKPIKFSTTGETNMTEHFTEFDAAEYLDSPEAIEVFMVDAFATGDTAYIANALGVVARAKGMSQVAQDTGLSREQLYRSFSKRGNPTLKTTLTVMQALGLEMTTKGHD